MAKALGSELTEFCTNHFPEGYCHDEFNKDIDQARRNKLGDSGYIWDVSNHALTLKWWDRLGIDDVLAFCLENPYSSVSPEIRAFSDRLAESQSELGEGSKLLGIKIPWRGENTQAHYGKVVQWLGMMLKALGIENKYQRVRDDLGNVLPRVYSIVPESLERLKEAIDPENFNPTQKYDLRNLRYIIPDGEGEARSFSSVFLKWKKTQTHETFLVTVPKESVAKAKADIKALGYSVS